MERQLLKSQIITFIFILILFAAFFVRINTLNYPYLVQDGNRDYLIARHIVNFGEYPLNGPGQLPNSPLYYYLLASIIFIRDDVMFLSFVNVVFQIAGLIFVYLLAKKLFNRQTAIISFFLFSFSDVILLQSQYIFQPHVMMPFANLSLLLLAISYIDKKYWALLFSILIFIIAGALHNPIFGLTPSFIIIVFLIHYQLKLNYKYYLSTVVLMIGIYIAVYSPLIILLGPKALLPISVSSSVGFDLSQFIPNMYNRSQMFMNLFFKEMTSLSIWIGIILLSCICLLIKKRNEKVILAILILTVVQFLVVAASLNLSYPFPDRYFTPILGLFIILVSELITTIFSRYRFFAPMNLVAAVYLFNIFSSMHFDQSFRSSQLSYLPAAISLYVVNNNSKSESSMGIVKQVKNEIAKIQNDDGYSEPSFFQFRSYLQGVNYQPIEAAFLAPIEKDLGYAITKVNDQAVRGYNYITSDDYIFLICPTDEAIQCYDKFFSEYDYTFVKLVAGDNNYSIFATKKHVRDDVIDYRLI